MCTRTSAVGSFSLSVPENLGKMGLVRGKRHRRVNIGLQNVFKIFIATVRHVPRLAGA